MLIIWNSLKFWDGKVVVKKQEFKVGDLAIYFCIDSILPANSNTEFLKSHKYHLITKKIRGVISQGLLAPLSWLPDGYDSSTVTEGQDLTSVLHIRKYVGKDEESQYNNGAKKWVPFPTNIVPKTDEERVQKYPSNSQISCWTSSCNYTETGWMFLYMCSIEWYKRI